ncbi:MAG: NusG domain II-containing protein [Oscillospiraceae bacterium]|nr:NusG domain II-containing protein [Oscillospiraceae bacterium]
MRRFAGRIDLLIISVLLAACSVWIFISELPASDDIVAQIKQGNEILIEINLSQNRSDEVIILSDHVKVKIEGGSIGFADVDCPDKLCERTGMLSRRGSRAVCLPNRMAIVII